MSPIGYTVRTWTAGQSDFQDDNFATEAEAIEYAEGSRLHGFEATVSERQPDLFGATA